LYHPDKVIVTINGDVITNITKDGITISKVSDNITPNVGLNGHVAIAINVDHSAECTFSVQHGSASYSRLRRLAEANADFDMLIEDANEFGRVHMPEQWCMFKQTPSFGRNNEISGTSFTIYIPYWNYREDE
jgi:hypothetical protein